MKKTAKCLEKSIGGTPIENETLKEVVEAIKQCKDIPENVIRGLVIVIISNTLNNKSKLSDRPFDIVQQLLEIDYKNTVGFLVLAVSKQLPSTIRYN